MNIKTIKSEKRSFLQHSKTARGLSRNTLDAYGQDLEAFIRFLEQENHEALDGTLVIAYLEHLKTTRAQKQATIRRRLVTLRAFTTWLLKSDLIETNPFMMRNPSSAL